MAKHQRAKWVRKGSRRQSDDRGRTRDINWDAQPYGRVSDAEIARKLGVSTVSVLYHRNKRRIAPFDRWPRRAIKWERQPLGKVPDARIAKKLGVSAGIVAARRRKLAIAAYSTKRVDWDAQPLGKMKDAELAKQLGVAHNTVARERLKRGIPSFMRGKLPVHVKWDELPYATSSDAAIARKYGVSEGSVQRHRLRLGIWHARVQGLSRVAREALESLMQQPGAPKSEWAMLEFMLVDAVKRLRKPKKPRRQKK